MSARQESQNKSAWMAKARSEWTAMKNGRGERAAARSLLFLGTISFATNLSDYGVLKSLEFSGSAMIVAATVVLAISRARRAAIAGRPGG